jgi:hypothetical protein
MSKKYHAKQTIEIFGWECGTSILLTVHVDFTVHPGCKQTLTEPGEEPSIEVDDVRFLDGLNRIKLPSSIEGHFTCSEAFTSWLMSEAESQNDMARDDEAHHQRETRDWA